MCAKCVDERHLLNHNVSERDMKDFESNGMNMVIILNDCIGTLFLCHAMACISNHDKAGNLFETAHQD